MGRPPSIKYTTATILTAILTVVSVWLPWVQKLPAGYIDGQPYYTMEWVPGLEAGFQGTDPFAVLLAILVIVTVIAARKLKWPPDGVLVVVGTVLVWWSGTTLQSYSTVDRYAIEPGLYLCLVSGVLLILLGVGAGFQRYLNSGLASTEENSPTT